MMCLAFALGCDDDGEGVDCRGGSCLDGFFCDRVEPDKYRCREMPPSGPNLRVDPQDKVEFPKTAVGAFDTRAVQIRQFGDLPVTVTRIYLFEAEGCDRVSAGVALHEPLPPAIAAACDFVIDARPPDLPLTLAGGDFRNLSIRFEPRGGAVQTTWLVIESDDVRNPTYNLPLEVAPDVPRLAIDENVFVFTQHRGPQSAELTVSSRGAAPLVVDRMWMELGTDPYLDPATGEEVPELTTTWAETLPATLMPGESITVSIDYDPKDLTPDEATFFVAGNDPERRAPTRVLITSLPVEAQLTASPTPLMFRGPSQEMLRLRNPDMPALALIEVRAEPADVFVPRPGAEFDQLRSLESHDLLVEYVPSGAAMDRGMLYVLTNARNADEDGEVAFELVGDPVPPPEEE